MKLKDNFLVANTAIFASVAVMHLMRIVFDTTVSVGGFDLEMWLSGVAIVVMGGLAWANWTVLKESTKQPLAKLLLGLFCLDAFAVFYSWVGRLEYWGFTNDQFGMFLILDLVVVAGLAIYLNKRK
ncbi:hypothetical protein COV81_05870 [Candidatus Peregrinibacteria bacterium CG11_big_fil_rev_8_21_14_0_20_41_10]|nr:MAG: hypothetical protein COV81_05870 [Candidatus Peregrinibacteria bacterium CG11_big_fil_rev_8_21_14_0_20_41_10]PIZ73041.1 MAG: hypothetical protein COY06_05865 [Candidatus Peregrinibacteria bacterium CG_4_10_14_0_2_um_filter_41_8]PJC37760.1 MAG: hypothetical protein CO045_03765 [Candidatus Peregrinibacteria bacterium CG_4_9_14_0_2_um_filter_41_14]